MSIFLHISSCKAGMCLSYLIIIALNTEKHQFLQRLGGGHALSKQTRGGFKNSASPEGTQI